MPIFGWCVSVDKAHTCWEWEEWPYSCFPCEHLGSLWEGSDCHKVSEVKGETSRLSSGYIMTWSLSSPFGRQLVRCCLLSTEHLYPILTFFFFFLPWWDFKRRALKKNQVEATEINCLLLLAILGSSIMGNFTENYLRVFWKHWEE